MINWALNSLEAPERTIQVLEEMLRACLINFGRHWDKFLPLCKFSYNNNYHSNFDPFEALYERGCRSPIRWFEVVDVKPLGGFSERCSR